MSEHISSFILEADEFIRPSLEMAKALDSATIAGYKAVAVFNKMDDEGNVVAQTLKLVNANAEQLTFTTKKVEETFRITSAALSSNTTKLKENEKAVQALFKKWSELQDLREQFGRGQADFNIPLTGSQESRNALTTFEQNVQRHEQLTYALNANEVRDNKRALEQQVKDWSAALEEEAALHERTQRRIKAQAEATAEAIGNMNRAFSSTLNSNQADAFAKNKLGQIQPFLSTERPDETFKVGAALGGIHEKIASGAISAARANEIFTATLAGQPQILSGVEKSVASLALQTRVLGSESEKTVNGINLGWSSLARIAVIQVLHRAIYEFADALRTATTEAAQFQVKISEIRTISQDSGRTFDDWSKDVRRLSDEFNRPIEDVAKGTYEVISNQIAKGADATIFLSKALQFAQTTSATTAQSVDLLSSAINAYGLKAQDVDRVTSVLFKTIDLGRTTAAEMSSTFGRVAVPAGQLGVSLEETAAAVATLTINGVKTSEAFTQINSIFTAFLKPSKEMKEFFKSVGVDSGEAAFATFGFGGAMQKLTEFAAGSNSELAALIQNSRGLRGALGFKGDFAAFEDTLNKIKSAGTAYQNAVTIATESAGFKFQLELNKVKNFFTAEVGVSLVESIVKVSDALGGLDNILRKTLTVFTTGIEVFTVYKAYQIASSILIQKTTLDIATETIATKASAAAHAERAAALAAENAATVGSGLTKFATFALPYSKSPEAQAIITAGTKAETIAEVELGVAVRARALAEAEASAAGFSTIQVTKAGAAAAALATGGNATLAASFAGLRTSILASSAAFLTSPLFFIAAGFALYNYFRSVEDELSRIEEKSLAVSAAIAKIETEQFVKVQTIQSAIFHRNLDEQYRGYLQQSADVRKLSLEITEVQIEHLREVSDATKAAVEVYISGERDKLNEIRKNNTEAVNIVKQAQKDIESIQRAQASKAFERTVALAPDDQKDALYADRFNQLKKESAAAIDAGNVAEGTRLAKEALEVDQEQFKRTEAAKKRLATIDAEEIEAKKKLVELNTRQTDQDAVRAKTAEHREDVLSKKTGSKGNPAREYNDDITGLRDKSVADTEASEKRRLQARIDAFDAEKAKLLTIYGKNGLMLTAEETAQKFRERDNEILDITTTKLKEQAAIQEKAEIRNGELRKNNEAELFALRQVFAEIEKVKLPKEVKSQKDVDKTAGAFDTLVGRAEALGLADQAVYAQFTEQRNAILKAGTVEANQYELDATVKKLEQLKKYYDTTFAEIQTNQKTALEKRQQATSGLDADQAILIGHIGDKSGFGDTEAGSITDLFESLKNQKISINVASEKIKRIIANNKGLDTTGVQEFLEKSIKNGDKETTIGAVIHDALVNAQHLTDALDLQKRSERDFNAAAAKSEIFKKAQEGITAELHNAAVAAENFGFGLDAALESKAAEVEALTAKLRQLKAEMSTPIPTGPGQAIGSYAPMGFAIGGRGVDTVPALLRLGEMVMNPGAVGAFYPLLKALNTKGQNPQAFAIGGEVNFGGNEINIISQGDSKVDASALWKEFEYLARRGQISMRGN